jgi:hypothetical protein
VEDAFGNLVTTADNQVVLRLLAGPAGASLSGTTSAQAENGVAAFDDLKLDNAGLSYVIGASSPGLAGASTSELNVSPAAPAHLVITLQPPASVTAGNGFGLGVSVEDAFGNAVSGFAGEVSVSLERGPAGAGLSGATTVQASQGVATFSGLTIDQAGAGDVLDIVADGVGSLSTNAFQVTPAAPSQLVIVDQLPAGVIAGQSFGFTVVAEDRYGNVATSFNNTVAAALAQDPAGGSLSGTVTTTAVGGVATFTGLAVDKAGSGYAIEATSGGLTSNVSTTTTVSPAAPSRLIITLQPSGSVVVKRPFALSVEAVDAFGNLATDFDGLVTAALGTNPGRNTLGGTLSVRANGGQAVITDVTLRRPGKSYAITITSTGLTPAASTVFNATRPLGGGFAAARRLARSHPRGPGQASTHTAMMTRHRNDRGLSTHLKDLT